jgi:hypothetical protein
MTYTLLTVKSAPYNAIGAHPSNDTAAIQAMIDDSAPGHLTSLTPVEQLFPIIIPPGYYQCDALNARNIHGLTIIGIGSGSVGPVIDWNGSPDDASLDCRGSDGITFQNWQLRGPIGDGPLSSYPKRGLWIDTGSTHSFENFNIGGRYSIAAMDVYGACCSGMSMCGVSNYAAAGTCFGAKFNQCSDWLFDHVEMHCFVGGGIESGKALLLQDVDSFSFKNGQFASAQGYLMQFNGNDQRISFDNVTFGTDVSGPLPFTCIGGIAGSNAKQLMMQNCYVKIAAGGSLYNLAASTVSGYFINGTIERGGVVTQYGICPLGSSTGTFGAVL